MERQSDESAAGLLGDRREVWIVAGVFAVALAVRLAHLSESAENPTFARPVVDAQTYHELARDLAVKRYLGDGFFWQPFYYPVFLAAVYGVFTPPVLPLGFATIAWTALGLVRMAGLFRVLPVRRFSLERPWFSRWHWLAGMIAVTILLSELPGFAGVRA